MAGVCRRHPKHGSGFWHGHVLFNRRPSRPQIGFPTSRNRGYGICPPLRGRADAYLGRFGCRVESVVGPFQQDATSRVLRVVALDVDSLRSHIQSSVKTDQSASNRSGKGGSKAGKCPCIASVVGPVGHDTNSAASCVHARPVRSTASHFSVSALKGEI